MKRILFIFIMFFSISLFFVPKLIKAETNAEIQAKIEETKRSRDALLEQQKQLQAALDELSKQGQTLQTNVKSLDTTRNKLANDLKITQSNINTSNLTIEKLENDISENENEINDHHLAIVDSLRKLASYDKHSAVFDILTYRGLDDVWADTLNLWDIEDKLGDQISLLEKDKIKLIQSKVAKETQKVQLVSLSSELKGQKQVADSTRSAQAALLLATKSKEAEYQKMLAINKAQEAVFENQLFNFESQITASDTKLIPTAGRGVLSWPLQNIYINQYFGITSSSGRLYASGSHNGVDFRASVGTPVMAVRSGVIEGMGNTDDQRGCYSYGRWILIRHDNGLTSIYGHLSGAIVSTGQAVLTGQVIGYSGGQPGQYGSGYSTGPHLHLGLYASANVQIARFTTSINCKNVSIPLANPQDYLDPMAYLPNL